MDNFEAEAARIRVEIEAVEVRGRGHPLPAALKRRIVAFCRARILEGSTIKAVSAGLGISDRCVGLWLRLESEGHSRELARFVPMEVVRERDAVRRVSTSSLTLHGPAGLRVEGLDVAVLAELLRRLA